MWVKGVVAVNDEHVHLGAGDGVGGQVVVVVVMQHPHDLAFDGACPAFALALAAGSEEQDGGADQREEKE